MRRHITGCALLLAVALDAQAEVLSSSATHYELLHEGESAQAPEALWQRLVAPATWWSPAHTYSGDAGNLSLDLDVGGYWAERWPGGAVAHGRVVLVQPGRLLRLEAPFGPLQGVGAYTIWTISLEPSERGTRVLFREVASGPETANLAALAPAVDAVKAEAMARLTATP